MLVSANGLPTGLLTTTPSRDPSSFGRLSSSPVRVVVGDEDGGTDLAGDTDLLAPDRRPEVPQNAGTKQRVTRSAMCADLPDSNQEY
jgi:hypothetical protein